MFGKLDSRFASYDSTSKCTNKAEGRAIANVSNTIAFIIVHKVAGMSDHGVHGGF